MNSVYSRLNILPSLKMKIVEIGVLFFLFFCGAYACEIFKFVYIRIFIITLV